MRGYFAIGVEGISKPMNLGNLFRSAPAFGASFVFTVAAHYTARGAPEPLPEHVHGEPRRRSVAGRARQ